MSTCICLTINKGILPFLFPNRYHIKDKDKPRYYTDYRTLYLKTLQKVVESTDSERPFVSSSPSNGDETMKEGGIANNPQDEYFGDGRCSLVL